MASISTKKSGHRRILWGSGKARKCLYLGKVNQKQAEQILGYVENLIAAKATRTACSDAATNAWVNSLETFHDKLVKCGLVSKRDTDRHTLAQLIAMFEASKSVKSSTVAAIRQGTKSLLDYFESDRPVSTITPLDADKWRKALGDQRLAIATQSKRTQIVKQIFGRAVRWGLIPSNPFEDVRAGSQTNARRQHFVKLEDVQRVLDACPDPEWRLIIGLCRFAGLRCPSEVLALRLADIHFDTMRLIVTAEKTAHHSGLEMRDVPIVPALLPLLREVHELAAPGQEFAIERYRDHNANLRTQFGKILRRAGVSPWPRLFQNLRATCETELVAAGHPLQSIAKWMGHSPAIAAKHYLQVREADYAAASGINPASRDASGDALRYGPRALQAVATGGTDTQATLSTHHISAKSSTLSQRVQKETTPCTSVQSVESGRYWARNSSKSPGNLEHSASEVYEGDAPELIEDPDLVAVVMAWPDLSAEDRAAILAIVRGGGH